MLSESKFVSLASHNLTVIAVAIWVVIYKKGCDRSVSHSS